MDPPIPPSGPSANQHEWVFQSSSIVPGATWASGPMVGSSLIEDIFVCINCTRAVNSFRDSESLPSLPSQGILGLISCESMQKFLVSTIMSS